MREVLNNQQIVCPGTQHNSCMPFFFRSWNDDLLSYAQSFYKSIQLFGGTLGSAKTGRFRECSFGNVAAFEAVHHFKKISVKDVIKGFGMHMMNMQVSNANRMQSANIMGSFIDCIIDTTKNSWQYKQMYRVNHLHLENVRYLLNRLNEE